MNFEQILQKAQKKAQKLILEVERAYKSDNEITQEDIIKISNKFFNPKLDEQPVEQPTPKFRLTVEIVTDIYLKLNFQPCWTRYWFYDDLKNYPLIQGDITNSSRTGATPIAALCFQRRQEILDGTRKVNPYIKENSAFIEKPSHKWYLGEISQLTGLSCSYILGFDIGYDGNHLPKTKTSDVLLGHQDGEQVRKYFLDSKILEIPPDPFDNEQNPHKLSELFRIGYYENLEETGIEETNGN